jgi:hypothetical protein
MVGFWYRASAQQRLLQGVERHEWLRRRQTSQRTERLSMAPSERGGDGDDAEREAICRSVVSSEQRHQRSSERRAIYSRCGLQATLMTSLPPPAHRQKATPSGPGTATTPAARCWAHGAAMRTRAGGAGRQRESSRCHHGVLVCALGRRRT